jgi:hypothetical protein
MGWLSTNTTGTFTGNATSVARGVTYGAGHLVIVILAWSTNPDPSNQGISLSDGTHTYHPIGAPASSASGDYLALYYAYNTVAGTYTLTASWHASANAQIGILEEQHSNGAISTDPLDGYTASGKTGNGTTLSTNTIPVTGLDDIAVAAWAEAPTGNFATSGAWIPAYTGNIAESLWTELQAGVSASLAGAGFVATGLNWVGLGASFKAPAAAATTHLLATLGVGG